MATPTVKSNLAHLNEFLERVSHRDVSPVRAQCHLSICNLAKPTARYYKRKSLESCKVVLECIAPGQSDALFQLMNSGETVVKKSPSEGELVKRLITLYEESTSSATKKEILSLFVNDYSKSQMTEMIPGLTKYRIDEARKHAALSGPGKPVEVPIVRRARMDPVKVDHFIDFISSPFYLQDVAFGTKSLKLANGEVLDIPNVVRTVTSSRLVNLYLSFCQERQLEPLGRSTLFSILQV